MDGRITEQWESYLRAFGCITSEERAELLEASVSDDVIFKNPGGEGATRAVLIEHIQDFQEKMPGSYFDTNKLFYHHGELLAIWTMHKSDGSQIATGYNFIQTDDQSLFRYMAGFF